MRERDRLNEIGSLTQRLPLNRHFIMSRIGAYILAHPSAKIEGIQVRLMDGTVRTINLIS